MQELDLRERLLKMRGEERKELKRETLVNGLTTLLVANIMLAMFLGMMIISALIILGELETVNSVWNTYILMEVLGSAAIVFLQASRYM